MASPDRQAPTSTTDLEQRRLLLTKIARRGIGWLYWIAGVSVFNTLLYRLWLSRSGARLYFVVGLGATQFVDGFSTGLAKDAGAGSAANYMIAACALDALLVLSYCLAAKSMQRGMRWPLLAALAFYALDTLFLVGSRAWVAILFHGIGLWALGSAYSAIGELSTLAQGAPVRLAPPRLPTFELGGVPNFDEPDPSAPKPKGLFANLEGLPAVLGGLVLIGVLAAFAFFMRKL
jgi:hypothetical protein